MLGKFSRLGRLGRIGGLGRLDGSVRLGRLREVGQDKLERLCRWVR